MMRTPSKTVAEIAVDFPAARGVDRELIEESKVPRTATGKIPHRSLRVERVPH